MIYFFKKKNNAIIDNKNRSNSSKKNNISKGIIIENDFEDIIEGEEQKAAFDRLNKAFETFGKENLNINK